MKERTPLKRAVDMLGWILLVVAVLSMLSRPTAPVASATPTQPIPPTATRLFEKFPTRPRVSMSPTAIPLQATYTSVAGETPSAVATQTLLPIDTATLIPQGTLSTNVPTQTLIFFATATATPFGGSATPPVSVAYSLDGKPKACYKGPSLAYIEMDTFTISRIAGKDATGNWWFLLVTKGQGVYVSCWVASDQVSTGGNLAELSVVEPELPQITQVKIFALNQDVTDSQYTATVACDDGLTNSMLHFSGQIFANGPIKNIGYRWDTNAPAKPKTERSSIKSWDAPAQTTLDFEIPSKAATYTLNLRSTFPMEAVGGLQVIVKCK